MNNFNGNDPNGIDQTMISTVIFHRRLKSLKHYMRSNEIVGEEHVP